MDKQDDQAMNGLSPAGMSYRFLLKPLFFIFSLIFATCLVLFIERLAPSDLGSAGTYFRSQPVEHPAVHHYDKEMLRKLCEDYKNGVLTGPGLDSSLTRLLQARERVDRGR